MRTSSSTHTKTDAVPLCMRVCVCVCVCVYISARVPCGQGVGYSGCVLEEEILPDQLPAAEAVLHFMYSQELPKNLDALHLITVSSYTHADTHRERLTDIQRTGTYQLSHGEGPAEG